MSEWNEEEQAVLDLVAEISEIQGRSLPRGFSETQFPMP